MRRTWYNDKPQKLTSSLSPSSSPSNCSDPTHAVGVESITGKQTPGGGKWKNVITADGSSIHMEQTARRSDAGDVSAKTQG